MFGMADDEEPAKKYLLTSSSAAITPQDIVNSNLVTVMADSGASGHYFDDANIPANHENASGVSADP